MKRPTPAGPARRQDDGRPARSWRWGQLSGGQGLGIVVIAAVLGALVSVATKHEPGTLLGGFVVAGSLVPCWPSGSARPT